MRVERVRATRFLAFPELDLPLDETLTALTGPNGVGKTSVLEACKLLKVALAPEGHGELQELWSSAGWHGSRDYSVRVTINFDHSDEKETLDAFLTAAFVRILHVEQSSGADILAAATDALGPLKRPRFSAAPIRVAALG